MCRALLPLGTKAVERGLLVLGGLQLVRLDERLLAAGGFLLPAGLRSLDAIHVATAAALADDLAYLCTYDQWMAGAAEEAGLTVLAPT
ncbi:MAG: hypothetical protein ABJC62_07965 [Frankiaceae bacterium]